MHSYTLLAVLSLGVSALAYPYQSEKRVVTPDNTCGNIANGNNHGYTCDPSSSFGGACCSSSGYCGNTAAYCGTGCQSAFGSCGLLGTSPVPAKLGCVWVVPNAGSFTNYQKFDFSTMSTFPPPGLASSSDLIQAGTAPYSQSHKPENVNLVGGSLQLKVPGGQHVSPITGAEIYTTDTDILYASVRTWVQVSHVAGTCHGNFFYKLNNQETDIEILTGNLASGVHFTDQSLTGGASTTATHAIPADATSTYHEYRLDWINGKTLFYLDGALQQTFTVNVPDVAGEWLWNNWSNGDGGWSAGPPAADNIMKIQKIEMYYNRTGSRGTC